MKCPYCDKENKVREDAMRHIGVCISCSDILYELDESSREIRISKRFLELYLIIENQLDGLRKLLLKTDKEIIRILKDSGVVEVCDSEAIVPEKYITGMIEIIKKFSNENSISDTDTRQSTADMNRIIEDYIRKYDEFSRMFDGKNSAAEIIAAAKELREKEKEVNAFTRMFAMYLGTGARH